MGVLRGTVEEKELSGTVISSARSSLLKMKLLAAVVVVVMAGYVSGMDVGKGGVYDSPMAQDYYVRRFGFMFGGGRSGMYGLQALQQVEDPMHLHEAARHHPTHHHSHHHHQAQEKAMVELSPVVMKSKDRQPKQFPRFMAVP